MRIYDWKVWKDFLFAVVIFLYVIPLCIGSGNSLLKFSEYYEGAIQALNVPDYQLAERLLIDAVAINSLNADVTQLLGSIQLLLLKYDDAIYNLKRSITLDKSRNPLFISNYIEALRSSGNLKESLKVSRQALVDFPDSVELLFNAAAVEADSLQLPEAILIFERIIKLNPTHLKAWTKIGELYFDQNRFIEAELLFTRACQSIPNNDDLMYRLGIAKHQLNKFDEALTIYKNALMINPNNYNVHAALGAAYQSLGHAKEALKHYEIAIPFAHGDKGLINNYGSLLGIIGRAEEGVEWLKKALAIDPNLQSALINLGSYYTDEGLLKDAEEMFTRIYQNYPHPLLQLRCAVLLSPVSSTWANMLHERKKMNSKLDIVIQLSYFNVTTNKHSHHDLHPDRIHFYLVYHGLNDRKIQEKVSQIYHIHIPLLNQISPLLLVSPTSELLPTVPLPEGASLLSTTTTTRRNQRVRVGFMSKYFGIFEPHGLLLDGVIRYLPRKDFQVIALPVARTDGIPLSPTIAQAAEEIHEISLSLEHAINSLENLRLDVLIFADVLSEPMNHFLSQMRLARIQVAFWGNPITSGSPNIDYFISSDDMEHPYRNRMRPMTDPYTEQVMLLQGQGIWYFQAEDPKVILQKANLLDQVAAERTFTRSDFGLKYEWFIYFCPQSVFKMHPLFDQVIADILIGNPTGHVVVTGGRRKRWTATYIQRLHQAAGPLHHHRIHVLSRVSSEQFPALLRMADVLLHPFPFDGSRTAIDSLEAGIPYITLPSEYLRGRMGVAFYRTMNLPELVAKNRSDYINIATRLANDPTFLKYTKDVIAERRHLLWEDMEHPFSWTQFLSRATGIIPSPTWEQFIQYSGRDVTVETALRQERDSNRAAFQKAWGSETWLLEGGRAELPHDVHDNYTPRIFNNWLGREVAGEGAGASSDSSRTDIEMGSSSSFSLLPSRKTNADVSTPLSNTMDATGTPTTTTTSSTIIDQYLIDQQTQQRHHSPLAKHQLPLQQDPSKNRHSIPNPHLSQNPTTTTTLPPTPPPLAIDHEAVTRHMASTFTSLSSLIQSGQSETALQVAKDGVTYMRAVSAPLPSVANTKENLIIEEDHRRILTCQILVELGGMEYFHGHHHLALDHCLESASLCPTSSLAHACSGIAALYLRQEAICMRELTRSKQLLEDKQPFQSVTVTITQEAINSNILMALEIFKKYTQCFDTSFEMLAIHSKDDQIVNPFTKTTMTTPERSEQGKDAIELRLHQAKLLLLALIEWSPRPLLDHQHEITPGTSSLPPLGTNEEKSSQSVLSSSSYYPSSLAPQLTLLQTMGKSLLNTALDCLVRMSDDTLILNQASEFVTEILNKKGSEDFLIQQNRKLRLQGSPSHTPPPLSHTTTNPTLSSENKKEIVLLIQYYQASSEQTQYAMDLAFLRNLANGAIHQIILLSEVQLNFDHFPSRHIHKIRQYVIGKRLTFRDAIVFANQECPGKIVLLANSDIYFDASLSLLLQDHHPPPYHHHYPPMLLNPQTMLSLVRWVENVHRITLLPRTDSQDAWIFQSPLQLSPQALDSLDFYFGTPRCDNRLLYILSSEYVTLRNPAFAIHAIEIGNGIKPDIYRVHDAVVGEGQNILISDDIIL